MPANEAQAIAARIKEAGIELPRDLFVQRVLLQA